MVAALLVLGAVLTPYAATLTPTVPNLTYMLPTQVLPDWLAVLLARRTNAAALATGMVAGTVLADRLCVTDPDLGA